MPATPTPVAATAPPTPAPETEYGLAELIRSLF
jgi:hypothetical protein